MGMPRLLNNKRRMCHAKKQQFYVDLFIAYDDARRRLWRRQYHTYTALIHDDDAGWYRYRHVRSGVDVLKLAAGGRGRGRAASLFSASGR